MPGIRPRPTLILEISCDGGGDFLASFFLPALLDEPPFLRFVDVDTLDDVGVVTVAVVVVVAVVVAAEA